MTRTWRSALERVWNAEIENRLPLQSRAKVFAELEGAGLVDQWTKEFSVDRFGSIKVTGWVLTHAGRFLYCAECYDPTDAAP
jgi:hypothetical protein